MHLEIQILLAALSLSATISAHEASQKLLSDSIKSQGSPFGVGFDLTASYGSAAVSFLNGTTVTVASISAEQEYNDLLRHMSLPSSQHLSPPYNSLGESWNDMPRQYLRKARKALGLPASQDVGYLAKMLTSLRTVVEERVGSITTAGVTTMHLPALYEEDLIDAFKYVGMKYITFPVGDRSDYKEDPEACKHEQWNMTDQVVMAVIYTDTALSVSLSIMKSAYHLWEPPYRYLADFDLGFQASSSPTPEYWAIVELKLGEIFPGNPYYKRPRLVMLMGDRIEEPKFREVLGKVFSEKLSESPEILSKNGRAVAAEGAAEMAKRKLF